MFKGEISLNDEVKIIYLLELSGWSTSFHNKEQIIQSANKILEILSSANSLMQWDELFSAVAHNIGVLDEKLAYAIALCMSDAKKIQHQADIGWSKVGRENRYSQILSAMKLHNEKLAAAASGHALDSPKTELSEPHTGQPVKITQKTAPSPVPPDLFLLDLEKRYASYLAKVELIGEIPLSKNELNDISLHFRNLYADQSEQKFLSVIEQHYPASFLVFMVGHGVYGYNDGNFWQAHEQALGRSVNHADVGRFFEKALQHFGKPLFPELQKQSLRYVSLILAHGGIPNYCLKDYFNNIVRNATIRPQLLALESEELIEEILKHTSYIEHTDKPVLHFMEYGGRTAANLLDRSRKILLAWQQNQKLLSTEEAGLPAHLTEYFAKWILENKSLALVDRGARNKLKRPLLCLDPWGLGVFLYLPSQPVSALNMNDLYWKVESGDYHEDIKVRTRRNGDQIETREITLRLNDAPEKILIEFIQGENSFDWKINGSSSENLILAFDPLTGQVQNHVSARETWLMYPSYFFVTVHTPEAG